MPPCYNLLVFISIHALRKESDEAARIVAAAREISIHALRKESDVIPKLLVHALVISIHALRKESDASRIRAGVAGMHFNPRSP